MRRTSCRARRERGAATVEMALVLPFLFLLLFGIVDFGRMLNMQIKLTEAAREGARAAAFERDATDRPGAAAPRVGSVMDGAAYTSTVSQCVADGTAATTGAPQQYLTVTVRHEFEFVTPFAAIANLFGGEDGDGISMRGEGAMVCAY